MTVDPVTIAPGHWLRADAAASYQRMRAAGLPAGGITDAGRTRAEQEVMYARYLRGELVAYAAKPGTSKHETGRALDLSGHARAWVRAHGQRYGWLRDQVRNEPWHMEYVAALDLAAADTIPAPAAATPPPAPILPGVLMSHHAAVIKNAQSGQCHLLDLQEWREQPIDEHRARLTAQALGVDVLVWNAGDITQILDVVRGQRRRNHDPADAL